MDHALSSLRRKYKKFEKRFKTTAKTNADSRRKLATMKVRSSLAKQFVGAQRSERSLGRYQAASTSASAVPFSDLDADSVGACLARIERLKHISTIASNRDSEQKQATPKRVPGLDLRRVQSIHTLSNAGSPRHNESSSRLVQSKTR